MMKPEQSYLHKAAALAERQGLYMEPFSGRQRPAGGRDSPSVSCACSAAAPRTREHWQRPLVDALAGVPHLVISTMTEPVVQCARLDSDQQENWDLSLDSSPCSLQQMNHNNSNQSLCVLCSILGSKV